MHADFKKNNSKKSFSISIIKNTLIFIIACLLVFLNSCSLLSGLITVDIGATTKEAESDTAKLPDISSQLKDIESEDINVDLNNPEATIISNLKISGQAIDLKIQDNWLYLTNDVGMLYIIDISNKKNPKVTSKISEISSANIVIVKGDYVFVSYTEYKEYKEGEDIQIKNPIKECGFRVIDVKDKSKPKLVSRYIASQDTNKVVQGLYISKDYAFLSVNEFAYNDTNGNSIPSKLEIIDLKDISKPRLIKSISIDGLTSAVFVQGDYAYINSNPYDAMDNEDKGTKDLSSFLCIINISDKYNSPKIEGKCKVFSDAWGLYVKEDYVYLTSNIFNAENNNYEDGKLQVIDVKDKKNPKMVSYCEVLGGAWEIDYEDSYIFISNLDGGLKIVDVNDKKDPKVIYNLKTRGNSYDVEVLGFHGYIADGFNGLVIVELKNISRNNNLSVDSNKPPVSVIETFGDNFGQQGQLVYDINNPVYFSGEDSFDPEGRKISLNWNITPTESEEDLYEEVYDSSGKKLCIFFKKEGIYTITLKSSDGYLNDVTSEVVNIQDFKTPIKIKKNHEFTVEIEYILKNKGNSSLTDIECFISVPQSFEPFQILENKTFENTKEKVDYSFDEEWNLLAHFNFINQELKPQEELSTKMLVKMKMPEFEYLRLNDSNLQYEPNDKDLELYTKDDFFIDSDNPIIYTKAKSIIGNENNPYIIARKLYGFVIRSLDYDYLRANDKNYEFMYASEILKKGKGVCLDYSVLYTALLRAAGIPARLAGGIPVTAILFEEDKELDIAHEWVEIKLPGYGWIPIDSTSEEPFFSPNFYLNLTTNKGMTLLYSRETMDWSSYYYEGFRFSWDSDLPPAVEQEYNFRVLDLDKSELAYY